MDLDSDVVRRQRIWICDVGLWWLWFAEQAMHPWLESFERLIKVEAPTESQRDELRLLCEEIRRCLSEGLDPVLKFRDQADSELPAFSIRGRMARQHPNVDAWIDRIAGQKFATQSCLFWHTSLAAAQREADRTGQPVLNLRMLGRLDEGLSYANSRFFRTILYPHADIRRLLLENFVLQWQPVRQVPVVTVDFSDGKLLRQPLVGNSVHLLVASDEQVLNAMPGLVTRYVFPMAWRRDEAGGRNRRPFPTANRQEAGGLARETRPTTAAGESPRRAVDAVFCDS